MIKAASQGDGMTPFQEKVFRGAARASKRTGVPVTTHSDARHRGGEQQASVFEQEGLDPRMVCIGHSDEGADFDYLAGLARRGYALGFDHPFYGLPAMGGGTNGSPTWQQPRGDDEETDRRRLSTTDSFLANRLDVRDHHRAVKAGEMDQLNQANPDGDLFNVRNTIPYLRQIGVTDAQIRMITIANPRAFFARG